MKFTCPTCKQSRHVAEVGSGEVIETTGQQPAVDSCCDEELAEMAAGGAARPFRTRRRWRAARGRGMNFDEASRNIKAAGKMGLSFTDEAERTRRAMGELGTTVDKLMAPARAKMRAQAARDEAEARRLIIERLPRTGSWLVEHPRVLRWVFRLRPSLRPTRFFYPDGSSHVR